MPEKNIVSAATLPVIILVVLDLVSLGVIMTMDLAVISAVSLLIALVGFAVFIWAGYNAVKKLKFDIVNAGMVGLVAAVINGVIGGIINILTMPIIVAKYAGIVPGQMAAGFEVIGLIISVIIGAIVGFVLAAIGGLIGQKF